MKWIKSANEFDDQFIIDYINNFSPEDEGYDDYYIDKYIKDRAFTLTTIQIDQLIELNPDLKDFVADNYNESEIPKTTADYNDPIVVTNGEVVDGYHRIYEHFVNKDNNIDAYVAN